MFTLLSSLLFALLDLFEILVVEEVEPEVVLEVCVYGALAGGQLLHEGGGVPAGTAAVATSAAAVAAAAVAPSPSERSSSCSPRPVLGGAANVHLARAVEHLVNHRGVLEIVQKGHKDPRQGL